MISINQEQRTCPSDEQMNLVADIKNIWQDLRIWTRTYMLSTVSGFENLDAVEKKLYSIPLGFGEKIQMFYRQDFAEQLVQLLSMHVILTEQIITAIKQGDHVVADAKIVEIYENADNIATAMAQINPYWSYTEWKSMLYQYISLIIDQVIALMSGDYEKDINIYDRMTLVSRKMGDYMADGILQGLSTSKPASNSAYSL